MLKYLLQMWNIRKPIGVVGDYAFGPNDCHELIEIAGATPTTNAENFAYMASWAHDLGLKGDGEEPCPWKWIRPTLLPPFAADGTNNPNAHPGSLD